MRLYDDLFKFNCKFTSKKGVRGLHEEKSNKLTQFRK
jgi:hypothetical protein